MTNIEWTNETWNPTTGCDRISPGCDNCYALTMAKRLKGMGSAKYQNDGDPRTSGPGFGVTAHAQAVREPLRWKKPRRVFVNSMSDLFHDKVDVNDLHLIFGVMAATPQHTYQILTKRHGRMRSLLNDPNFAHMAYHRAHQVFGLPDTAPHTWPLPNVWLGVSVENQKWADIRIPALTKTPAAIRFLSCEPLLGPVWIGEHIWQVCACCEGEGHDEACARCADSDCDSGHIRKIGWVIVGGESGPKARPMAPQWATSIRDQCKQNHVPFFFKQWGEYAPTGFIVIGGTSRGAILTGDPVDDLGHRVEIARVGKKVAGRELDGQIHDAFPRRASGG